MIASYWWTRWDWSGWCCYPKYAADLTLIGTNKRIWNDLWLVVQEFWARALVTKVHDQLPFHVDYSNVTEQYIVSAKIRSSVAKCTGTGPGAIAGMGALVGTGMVLAVAGVTVSRCKKQNVVGRAGGVRMFGTRPEVAQVPEWDGKQDKHGEA